MNRDDKESIMEIVDTSLEMVSGIPILSTVSKCARLLYYKNIRDKWYTFLQYAVNTRNFFEEIEKNKDLLEYLSDYFESIKTTPSFLAIKTMALIFRDFQDNKNMQQRTCRAFAGISDAELEIFLKLYDGTKNDNKKISNSNDFLEEKKDTNLNFDINNLSNRGFLFKNIKTGYAIPGTEFNFNYDLKFNNTSELYFKYINMAKKLKNCHIGSIINNM